MPGKRIGVVLSGGGARGAGQLGMMIYLDEQGVQPDFISGISVGSLNGTIWAQEGNTKLIEQIWRGIRGNSDIYKTNWFRPWKLFRAIYDNTPLWKKINKYVDPDKLRRSSIELKIGVVQLQSGAYSIVDKFHPHFQKMLLASTAIPIAFPVVNYQSRQYVDGGVRNCAPLKATIQSGCDKIYVLHCYSMDMQEERKDYNNLAAFIIRSFAILYNEILRNDIEICEDINRAVVAKKVIPGKNYRLIDLKLIAPSKDQSFGYELDFSPKIIARNIELGYHIAKDQLNH